MRVGGRDVSGGESGDEVMKMGQGAVGGGEEPMEMGQGDVGGGEGALRDFMILQLQTRLTVVEAQLEDKDAKIATRDVHLFAREVELTAIV